MNRTAREAKVRVEGAEFCALVGKYFDADYYKQSYVDVASTGLDPLEHWLSHGFREGRQFSRSVLVRVGTIAKRSADRNWRFFRWRGIDMAFRILPPVAPSVMSQIINQGQHDSAVLAPGVDAIKNLVFSDREDVHLNVAGLQDAIQDDPEFLLIVPTAEGEQGLVSDLAGALRAPPFGVVQTIITEQESANAADQPASPECFEATQPVFWRDFWIEGPEHVKLWQLAQLIRVLRPRVTIVAGSRHGYEAVARFGRCLMEHTKLFCVYAAADEGVFSHYVSRTLPFAVALTDDEPLATDWRERYGDILGHAVVTVQCQSSTLLLDTVVALFEQ
jgi:hypothetical protein